MRIRVLILAGMILFGGMHDAHAGAFGRLVLEGGQWLFKEIGSLFDDLARGGDNSTDEIVNAIRRELDEGADGGRSAGDGGQGVYDQFVDQWSVAVREEEEPVLRRFGRLGIDPDSPFGEAVVRTCENGELRNEVRTKIEDMMAVVDTVKSKQVSEFLIKRKVQATINDVVGKIAELAPFAERVMEIIPVEVTVSDDWSSVGIDVSLPCGSSLSFDGNLFSASLLGR